VDEILRVVPSNVNTKCIIKCIVEWVRIASIVS
jgi:hypothetical protein